MSNQNNLSKREETLLKSLVESFICDGQPVGSSKLSKIKSVNLSSATIRNVFTDLEEMGLIYSPHTSAGRIPTTKGFRLFIDTMVNFQPINDSILSKIKINNVKDVNQEELLKNTNEMLSNITQLAGVVYLPPKENLHIRQIDFVRVNKNKVLAILISSDNQVENKILNTSKDFSNSDLEKAANYLNSMLSGKSKEEIKNIIISELEEMRKSVNEIMFSAINMGKEIFVNSESKKNPNLFVAGQTNLMQFDDLSDVEKLKTIFDAFNDKKNILSLLDQSITENGIKVFIGSESGYNVFDDCSVITAPYTFDDNSVGVLGVVGPTRMAYDRVIPIVDVTAKLLSEALKS